MKITIVPNDNTVLVDGKPARLDPIVLEALRKGSPYPVRAVQFDGFSAEVEYERPANERIGEADFLERFGGIVDAAQDALQVEAEEKAAAVVRAEEEARAAAAAEAALTPKQKLDRFMADNPDVAEHVEAVAAERKA